MLRSVSVKYLQMCQFRKTHSVNSWSGLFLSIATQTGSQNVFLSVFYFVGNYLNRHTGDSTHTSPLFHESNMSAATVMWVRKMYTYFNTVQLFYVASPLHRSMVMALSLARGSYQKLWPFQTSPTTEWAGASTWLWTTKWATPLHLRGGGLLCTAVISVSM